MSNANASKPFVLVWSLKLTPNRNSKTTRNSCGKFLYPAIAAASEAN